MAHLVRGFTMINVSVEDVMRYGLLMLVFSLVLAGNSAAAGLADQGNGTVSDSQRGLLWQQTENSRMSWAAAVDRCEGLQLGDRSDWRLPTREELLSLVAPDRQDPAIDTTLFPKAKTTAYWTSSREQERPWGIGFSDGEEYLFGGDEMTLYVRCVADVHPGTAAPAQTAAAPQAMPTTAPEDLVRQWAKAWSKQDLESYLSFYSEDFNPGGLGLEEWKIQRRRALSRPQWIKVEVMNLTSTETGKGQIEAVFDQVYRSDIYQDKVRKKLLLDRQDGAWHIVKEETVAILN